MRRLAGLLAALVASSALAVLPPARPGRGDWDVRGERAGLQAAKTPGQADALQALIAEREASGLRGDVVLIPGPEEGTLHHLFARRGVLSPPGAGRSEDVARAFLARHRGLLGLDEREVRELRHLRSVEDLGTGARHVVLEQSVDGVPVFQGEIRVHLDRAGRVVSVAGNSARPARRRQPSWMSATDALRHAGLFVGVVPEAGECAVTGPDSDGVVRFSQGPFAGEPWAWRAWFPLRDELRPAWVVTLDAPSESWDQVVVDAVSGAPLHRVDLVEHAATEGLVFREDPDQGPQVLLPFVDDGVNRDAASPLGWSSAGLTSGNNCDVKDDIANDNETSAGRRAEAAAGPPLAFRFPFTDDPSRDLDASLTNLFWLNNWLHDRLVRLGFDEASGNFQDVNVTGQGRGGDAVLVDSQDGSGRNNANFGTPPDGFPPRMQMYLWTFTSPWRDSGFDGSVVTHELFHGVSNRLVGLGSNGAGCLGGPQGGAMGEAWSDFFACSFWDTPVVGGYVVDNPVRGIRRAPYDDYPFGYGDLCNQGGFEVHADGEIWAATLWDIRTLFIAKHGFQQGRCLVERLALDAMKLAPCLPTFVDMRDAMILAAELRGGDGDACLMWQGFAGRGLGTGAASRSGCTTPADASFAVPPECAACDALEPPTNVRFDASQPNRVIASFTPSPGATEHLLLRAAGGCPGECAETPFEIVATGAGDAGLLVAEDAPGDPMSAGGRFAFRVIARNGACTAGSPCADALVVGRCTLPPVGGDAGRPPGVVALARPPSATCALRVEWSPARASCGASSGILYNIYRSIDPAFTPGPEHLVATVAAPATQFLDGSATTPEATYVVRAEDLTGGGPGPHGGNEERNEQRLSAAPVGPVIGTTTFSDDGEGGELPGYRRTGSFPINDWAIVSDANTRGGSAWHVSDVEGGNADKNLHLPPLSLGAAPRLRFRHAFWVEDAFDGGVIEISIDGGRSWRDLVDDVVAGGYETSRGAGTTQTVADLLHPPNTNRLWTGQNASGFPSHDDVDVDLAPYAGAQDALLRFRLLVDPLAVEPGGWYVDDVVVDDVLDHDACGDACTSPPVALLPDAAACASATEESFALLEASAVPGASPLRGELAFVFTHEGPGSFAGRRWAAGPSATLAFPPGTPAGSWPVTLTVRDEAGCAATRTASVTLRDETVVPPAVGPTLRVAKQGAGLRLVWAGAGAPAHNLHVAAFGTDLQPGLHALAPWMQAASTSLDVEDGLMRIGAGSAYVGVFSASDCGRSIP